MNYIENERSMDEIARSQTAAVWYVRARVRICMQNKKKTLRVRASSIGKLPG